MLIDTHSHIYLEHFDDDRDEVIKAAKDNGVEIILMPNIDSTTVKSLHQVEKNYDGCVAMMGLHPTSVKDDYKQELDLVEKALGERSYIGVGEIGIDLYWDKSYKKEQITAFKHQIIWAKELDLPIVIHCREAFNEIFKVVDELYDERLRGVFHSFSGGVEEAEHVLSYQSFKLGINGVVTFKKSDLPEVLEHIDPKFLVIETDAPYLTPSPYRGKRNQPAYLKYVVNRLCEIYHIEESQLEKIVEQNSLELFEIKDFVP